MGLSTQPEFGTLNAYPALNDEGQMQCVPLAGGSFRALPPEVIGAHFDDYVELGSEDKQPIDTYPKWVATFNACTLRGHAKRHSFERQWHGLRCFAIGFQEARPKKTRVYESEYYWVVSSAANGKGGLGPELWLHRTRSLGRKHGRKITVSRPMITVVHAGERRLIVKFLPQYIL